MGLVACALMLFSRCKIRYFAPIGEKGVQRLQRSVQRLQRYFGKCVEIMTFALGY